jgi:hypothetical protein
MDQVLFTTLSIFRIYSYIQGQYTMYNEPIYTLYSQDYQMVLNEEINLYEIVEVEAKEKESEPNDQQPLG